MRARGDQAHIRANRAELARSIPSTTETVLAILSTDAREERRTPGFRRDDAMVSSSQGAASDLVLARDLLSTGTYGSARAAAGPTSLQRVRWGAYAQHSRLEGLDQSDRHALHVVAACAMRRAPIVTGISAAVLYGLPLIGPAPTDVQLLSSTSSGRRRNGVVEVPRWTAVRVDERRNPRMTALPDTLIEVCRTASFITALTMVDAALNTDRLNRRPPLATREDLDDAYERRMPFRGCARVRSVLSFAVTGAESPFETLSRVTIRELGLPEPLLQHELVLPDGSSVYGDFGWPDFRVIGEADGWGKYVNPRFPARGTLEERIRAEKRRDNAVRRLGWTPAHWEWSDAWNRTPLLGILSDAGLPVTGRRRLLR